jgi:hypothetical protein
MVTAASTLQLAARLDPSQAFYWRELGAIELAAGSAEAGKDAYWNAVRLVPVDPVSLRGLALAQARSGDLGATDTARLATGIKPLSGRDWLILALVADQSDPPADSLSRALLLDPWLAATGWPGTALSSFDRPAETRRAATLATESPTGEERLGLLLINLMTSVGDPARALDETSPGQASTSESLITMWRCDQGNAWQQILDAEAAEREQPLYWFARSLVARAANVEPDRARALARLAFGVREQPAGRHDSLLAEYPDVWRYRHYPIGPTENGLGVPGPHEGILALTADPAAALGMAKWPPGCGK